MMTIEKPKLSLANVNGNAFVLYARAAKQLDRGELPLFQLECKHDKLIKTPSSQVGDTWYDEIMAAVQRRFECTKC